MKESGPQMNEGSYRRMNEGKLPANTLPQTKIKATLTQRID